MKENTKNPNSKKLEILSFWNKYQHLTNKTHNGQKILFSQDKTTYSPSNCTNNNQFYILQLIINQKLFELLLEILKPLNYKNQKKSLESLFLTDTSCLSSAINASFSMMRKLFLNISNLGADKDLVNTSTV